MLVLNSELQALFSLLGNGCTLPSNINWNEVKQEAKEQSVFMLIANSPLLPDEIRTDWKLEFVSHYVSNTRSLYAIQETNRIMKSIDCKYVILKGIAAASYYNEPFYRALGDVDFLIEQDKKEIVEQALENEGYKNCDNNHPFHVAFKKIQQNLEMHFEISGVPDGKSGELVHEYLKPVFDNTIIFNYEGEIHIPRPKYHGLILLLHMQHHMLSCGIGLRHLMDWNVFVNKTEDEDFWKADLIPLLKKIGLYKYAQVMTKTGALYFGTTYPDWCRNADEDLCDEVMKDILTGGNFGRKNQDRAASGYMISNYNDEGTRRGKIYNLWNILQHSVRSAFPIVKEMPLFYPIFDLVIIFKHLWRMITGKRKWLTTLSKYADQRKKVYDQLEIFENGGSSD